MNKLETGFAVSVQQAKAIRAVFSEAAPDVFELTLKEGRASETLRVLDPVAFKTALGEGAYAIQGGLEGHRHFEACTIVIREIEKREERVAKDAVTVSISPSGNGRTFNGGNFHGYTLHTCENICGICGGELFALDGHFHSYSNGAGMPDACCCKHGECDAGS